MLVSLLCFFGAATVFAWSNNDAMVGKGQWIVEGVSKCPDPEKYWCELEVKKRKINRTHDGFTAKMNLPKEINEYSHGAYFELCKKVDGGCKLQYTMSEPSICQLVKKYAEKNFYDALTNAGLETPDCPIPQGDIEIKDFVMNYKELPEDYMLGEFTVLAFLTEGEERVLCISIDFEFRECDEE